MLRSRVIFPGIATNEILAQLGPYATLLFERLWMLADREGRLEDRPARIRAEVFPYWPEVDVENLLEKLSESGFIIRYESDENVSLITVTEFSKYQHIHPHEKRSFYPPPPRIPRASVRDSKNGTYKSGSNVSNVITCPDMSLNVGLPLPLPTDDSCVVVRESPLDNEKAVEENAATTTNNLKPQKPPAAAKKPPTQEHAVAVPRKAPTREEKADSEGPHSAEDVTVVRESLCGLAAQVGLPPPDEGLVLQVLHQGYGASGLQIHETLVALWRQNKFRRMYSWGFVPMIIGQCFQKAAS